MAGVRVFQLAKELKVQSALILELLDRLGREVRSDLSALDAETADLVRKSLTAAIEAERRKIEETRHEAEAEAVGFASEQPSLPEESEAPPSAEPPAPVEDRVEELIAASETSVLEEAPEALVPEPLPSAVPLAAGPSGLVVSEPARGGSPAPTKSSEPPRTKAAPPAPPLAPAGPAVRRPRVHAAKRTVPIMLPAGRSARGPGARPATGRPDPGRPPAAPPAGPRPPQRPQAGRPSTPHGPADRDARRKSKVAEPVPMPAAKPKPDLPPVPESITLSEAVTVKELAEKLNRKSKDVIAKLLARGIMATINQPLDPQMALDLTKEFGSNATFLTFEEEQVMAGLVEAAASPGSGHVLPRPPVVTVMGHVDHGKTSLLDAIRAANVVSTEHGGITQHIGAYQVEEKGRKVTFLDTPGHEAFTMMRARGARVTDIVVLVVAADDGVKPQTLEAIDHARAAGVPIVVAINKIDKPDARPERVKQQLADRDLLVEEYGGKTVACEISAKKRQGIGELLDMILLVADLQDLKADADSPANGVVLEARLDRARGIVATVLVQSGTLRVGDPFIAGAAFGKIRAMADEHGRRVDSAGPSTPVEIMGFQSEPNAGDGFQSVADEQKARQIAQMRQEKIRAAALAKSSRRTLESLSKEIAEGSVKEMSVLVKADVQGSLEALQQAIGDLPSDKVRVSVLRASTGAINQADVLLATASSAIIVGFNVRPDRTAAELARQEEIEIRLYTVIYDVVNDLKQAMVGMLEPTIKESIIGQAEVRQLFKVPKVGTIAGSYVTEGRIARSAEVRLIRDNVVIYTGRVGSLRRFKDDASEVKQGFECGIGIANFNDLKEGDIIEFFVMEKVAAQSL